MKAFTVGMGVTAVAITLLSGVASAESLEQVTVGGSHILTVQVERSSSGIPIEDVSLSVPVNSQGLDLTTQSGLNAMERRVRDAATSACDEISRQHPFAEPSDAECVIHAVRKPLSEVRQIAEAERISATR